MAAKFRLRYGGRMAGKDPHYDIQLKRTGNTGAGTPSYSANQRAYVLRAKGKPEIMGSTDPAFRGNAARWNPEDLLVASLSACHRLWYLHLCADAGINAVA